MERPADPSPVDSAAGAAAPPGPAALHVDVLTVLPGYFTGPLDVSLLGRARAVGLVTIAVHDLRDHATDRHRTVDDAPFGGGAGMVLTPGPFFAAVEARYGSVDARPRTVLFTPRGRPLTQRLVADLAAARELLLLCGRYEGVDERVATALATDEVSLGDYVLAGGEVAACALIEAVVRLVPGVMGNAASAADESFSTAPAPDVPGAAGLRGLLEYPQYTRPAVFRGMSAPDVLRGGDHGAVARWRREQAAARTREVRPDLWSRWVAAHPDDPLAADPPDPRHPRGDSGRP